MGTFIENPVLQKEMSSHFRARRQTKGVRVASMLCAGAIVLLLYYFGARAILHTSNDARDCFMAMVSLQMVLILFLAPSLTAGAITQEREQQTWNALLLSRLSADEIVIGKLVARLVPAVAILLLFAPLGILAAFFGEIRTATFVLSYLLLLLSTVFFAAIGMFCSWAYRRTVGATSATFGVIAFLTVGTALLYSLWTMARLGRNSDMENFPLMWLNPFVALSIVLSQVSGSGLSNDQNAAPFLGFLFTCVVGTLGLLFVTVRRLSRGPKELEQ